LTPARWFSDFIGNIKKLDQIIKKIFNYFDSAYFFQPPFGQQDEILEVPSGKRIESFVMGEESARPICRAANGIAEMENYLFLYPKTPIFLNNSQ